MPKLSKGVSKVKLLRLTHGLSQTTVSKGAGIERWKYALYERGAEILLDDEETERLAQYFDSLGEG
jgi:DNA-binding XRE family transcriptional regulator